VPLIADLIRDSSNINDWVLDCFVGGGTIFIAAQKTDRRAAGIEIDPIYCDLSIERWQAFTGQSAVLAETGETFAQVAERRRNEEKDAALPDAEVRHG
jgi:DNA modification methylase